MRLRPLHFYFLIKLVWYQKADTSYLEKAQLILELAKKASTLLKSANIEQKRKYTNFLFSNCSLTGQNLDLQFRSPFDKMPISSKTGNWRPLVDTFRTSNIECNITLARIQGIFKILGIQLAL